MIVCLRSNHGGVLYWWMATVVVRSVCALLCLCGCDPRTFVLGCVAVGLAWTYSVLFLWTKKMGVSDMSFEPLPSEAKGTSLTVGLCGSKR